ELDGEDVFLLHRCCERQTVLTNASYRTVVPVLDIVAVHEVEPLAVGNPLPQGMRHALAHFIPAHVRDFQALPGFLQVGAEKADTPGNQADTIDAAVLFTEIHHGLHADADTQHRLSAGGLTHHLIKAEPPDFMHAVTHGADTRQHHAVRREDFFRLGRHNDAHAFCHLLQRLGRRVQVAHAVIDNCDRTHVAFRHSRLAVTAALLLLPPGQPFDRCGLEAALG